MKTNGCYNCINRKVGCHSECKEYQQYKSTLEKIKEKKKKEQIMFAYTKRS